MTLVEWVDEVKATGGVPEGSHDTLAAMRAASTLCWAEIERMGRPCSEVAQCGIKWTAAFMVSCARHDATGFGSILTSSDHRQRIFQFEATTRAFVDGDGGVTRAGVAGAIRGDTADRLLGHRLYGDGTCQLWPLASTVLTGRKS